MSSSTGVLFLHTAFSLCLVGGGGVGVSHQQLKEAFKQPFETKIQAYRDKAASCSNIWDAGNEPGQYYPQPW